jgi:hypothetical protein
MKIKTTLFTCLILASHFAMSQGTSKPVAKEFGWPILADSSATFIIPTVYSTGLFSSNKLSLWGDFYSNVIFYNFKTDESKKLFEKDTYIVSLNQLNSAFYSGKKPTNSLSGNHVFYRVMNKDHNKNGEIDNDDPAILYISDNHGNNVKALSNENENVLNLAIYEMQNIALVKIQRDSNQDGNFNSKDNDFYFVKLDLNTLEWGKKIELK